MMPAGIGEGESLLRLPIQMLISSGDTPTDIQKCFTGIYTGIL